MPNIVLIGFMASGKTTLGKKLASRLGYTFVDTDTLVEQLTGKTVAMLFEQDGEAYFRAREREVLESLKALERYVIATGGGLPCFEDNMSLLNQIGLTIYLKTSPKSITQRLLVAKKPRPLAQGKNEEELLLFVSDLLKNREQYYSQAKVTLVGKAQHLREVLDFLRVRLLEND